MGDLTTNKISEDFNEINAGFDKLLQSLNTFYDKVQDDMIRESISDIARIGSYFSNYEDYAKHRKEILIYIDTLESACKELKKALEHPQNLSE